jgi:tetratricopeptide (TPR) repeat protein
LAHESPEHVIEDLTAAIARRGPSAKLYYRRASEYRVLGRLESAAADLQSALRLDAEDVTIRAELSRVRLAQGQAAQARAEIERALAGAENARRRAHCLMVRSAIHAAEKDWEAALVDCREACRIPEREIDWVLERSRLQAHLGRHGERIDDLAAALRVAPGAVVQIEWVEALIDAGRWDEALPEIDRELADSRWQSSWLLRRARVHLGQGRDEAAAQDLWAAVAEIDARFNPQRPDVTLLADRGLARALLQDRQGAKADLAEARRRQAPEWLIHRLAAALAAEPPRP